MPRDLVRLFFTERARAHDHKRTGELLSRVRPVVFGANNVPMLCADVRVSGEILSAVPLAENNHRVQYALPGAAVELQRSDTGRLEITGLSKRGIGHLYQYTLAVSTGVVTSGATIGYGTRTATLGELATATSGGFGYTPLQALLLIDASGAIINVIA